MQYTVSTIFRGVDQMTGTMRKMATNSYTFAEGIEKRWRGVGVRLERLNSAIRGTIASGAAWGAAVAIPMGNILKTGAEFEDTLIRAFSKLDETVPYGSKRFIELKKRILDATMGTEFLGSQAAGAFQELAGAGYDVERSIKSLPVLFKASRASQMELNETSVRMVDLLKTFNLEAKDADVNTRGMARAANILAKADAMGTTNMRQLFEAIQNGGSAAVAAGADLETFAAMAINLADIKGFEAGTGLKLVFTRLLPTEENKRKLIQALDLRMEDRKTGKLRDYVDILGELQQKLSSKTDYQRNIIIGKLFGTEGAAARKMMEVLRAAPELVRKTREELRGEYDQLEKLNAAIQASPTQQWKKFLSDIDRTKNTLYDILRPAAIKGLEKLTAWLNNPTNQTKLADAMSKFADKVPAIADAILFAVENLDTIIKALVVARVSELVAKLISGVAGLSTMLGSLKTLFSVSTAATISSAGMVGGAAMVNPIMAIVALTAGIYTLIQSVDFLRNAFDGVGEWLGNKLFKWLNPDDDGGWTGSVGHMADYSAGDRGLFPTEPQVVPQQSSPASSNFRFYTENPNLKVEPMPQTWEPGGLKLIQSGAF